MTLTQVGQGAYWRSVYGASFPHVHPSKFVSLGPPVFKLADGTQIVTAVRDGKVVGSSMIYPTPAPQKFSIAFFVEEHHEAE